MKIYLEPFGGLCNRMRAISSVYELAELMGAKLIVRWISDDDLFCPSEALFTLPEQVKIENYRCMNSVDLYKIKIQRGILKLLCHGVIRDDTIISVRGTDKKGIDAVGICNNKKNIFLRTCESLREDFYNNDYSIFHHNEDRVQEAKKMILNISDGGQYRVIGLHIRRTDNTVAIASSATKYYFEIIDALIRKNENVRFYLATDSVEEKKSFYDKYNNDGQRIIFTSENTVLERNSVDGMKAAYQELLCLSYTDRILGSFYSSYSSVAAALNKKRIDLVNSESVSRILNEVENGIF